MSLQKQQKIIVALLALSAILGVEILVEDAVIGPPARYLWNLSSTYAPVPHSYALVGFVFVDLVLIALVFMGKKKTILAAAVWGVLQALAMALDPLSGPLYHLEPAQFARYLFGIWAFDLLLIVRIVLAAMGFRAYRAA